MLDASRDRQYGGRTAIMPDTATPIDLTPYRQGLDKLSAPQRRCMLLVAQGYSSKEIGTKLGVSSNRIDKHVINARTLLGNALRHEAARIVVADEERKAAAIEGGQKLGAQFLSLAPPPQAGADEPANHKAKADVWHGDALAEEQAIYTLSTSTSALLGLMPLRSGRRPSNDLSTRHIMAIFLVLVMAAVITAGSAATFLTSLDSVVRR